MGTLQYTRGGRRGIHRGLSAGVCHEHRSPRPVKQLERRKSLPRGSRKAVDTARFEFVSFDTYRSLLPVGPNNTARGDELQGANAIQPRRPVHAQFDRTPNRQFVFRGEQNSATANVQRSSNTADIGRPRLHNSISYVLTNRKPASTPTFREPSDVSTFTICACIHGFYHLAFATGAQ